MLFRAGKNWVVDYFLRRGWLVRKRLRLRRRPSDWNSIATVPMVVGGYVVQASRLRTGRRDACTTMTATVPAECLEARILLSTITVTTLADSVTADGQVSLREAIQAANTDLSVDGSVAGQSGVMNQIVFSPALTGTIQLDPGLGQMTISSSLSITGNGSANTIIDAQHNSRIFNIASGAGDVTLDSLTLENGKTTADADSGGAIQWNSGGTLSILNSTLTGNTVTGAGANGGAISGDYGALALTGTRLSGNSASGYGGAVWGFFLNVTAASSTINNNSSSLGGAIATLNGGITVTGSTLSQNSVIIDREGRGGAIFTHSTVTISGSTVSGNSTNSDFGSGGAIYDGTLSVTGSTISGNSTLGFRSYGGAICSLGDATITNSTLTANSTSGVNSHGGALIVTDGSLTVVNGTIVQNHVAQATSGGIDIRVPHTATLSNTIVAQNTDDGTAPDASFGGSSLVLSHSLIGDNTGTGLPAAPIGSPDPNGNLIGTDAAKIDPQLGPLAFNGGLTQTMALLAGSAAINAGSNALATAAGLTADQRGAPFVRNSGGVDMGAYEVQSLSLSLVVNTTDDTLDPGYNPAHLTLRDAVALANGSLGADTITFAPSLNGQTISLALGEMAITESVTITGNGAAQTIVDGQHNSRIFNIASSAGDVTLEGLTLENGNANTDSHAGGAVLWGSFGTLSILDSIVTGNTASAGGAVYGSYGTISLTGSNLSGNSASGPGGAIFGFFTSVSASSSTLTNNSSTLGGAIADFSGPVTVTDSTLSQNFATGKYGRGGAIWTHSTVTMTRSTLSGNFTTGNRASGGAVYASQVVVTDSTLSGNSTSGYQSYGGAIDSIGGATVTNSTLTGNSTSGSGSHGGAIFESFGPLTVLNSTIAQNHAVQGKGGGTHSRNSFTTTLNNSIVAQNTDGGSAPDLALANGATLVVSHSLIGSNTGTGLTAAPVGSPDANGNLIGTNAARIDPQLGPLAFNGGPTQTMALLAGSPAIEAGSNSLAKDPGADHTAGTGDDVPLTTDQRGSPFVRSSGSQVDMGAYELQQPIVTSADDRLDVTFDPANLTLRDAIAIANADPGNNTITFSSALNGQVIHLTLGEMLISDGVTITGNGAASTIIDAQHGSRIFNITGGAGDVTLDGLNLENGTTTGSGPSRKGGAIRSASGGTLTVQNSTLTGNSTTGVGTGGGAIFAGSGALVLINDMLSQNSTAAGDSYGGAVFSVGSAVTVTNSTLSGNSTAGSLSRGGAIAALGGSLAILNSTFSGNFTTSAISQGGAVAVFDGPLSITNSTLTGNSALGAAGGAIFAENGAVITNSTIVQNDSGTRGGGIFGIGAMSLRNSIVAGNTDTGSNPDLYLYYAGPGTSLTVTYSLVGDNKGTSLTPAPVGTPDADGNLIGTDAAKIDPKLGALANNGGPTQTMALLSTSPAIGAGSSAEATKPGPDFIPATGDDIPLTTDQRGNARFAGSIDLGAFQGVWVSSIVRQNPATSPTNASNVTFRVTFNVPVQNVGSAFTVNAGSIGTVIPVSSSVYDVTVTGLGSFNGTLTLSFAPGQTITDTASNPLTSTTPTGTSNNTYVLDHVAPAPNSFALQTPAASPTAASTLVFRATFSEAVTGVDSADFKVNGTTTATVTAVAPVAGSGGAQYDVTISGGNLAIFNGVVGLDLKSGQNVTDLAGNALPTTEPAVDQTYTLDHVAPATKSFARQSPTLFATNATALVFRATFSEPVTAVDTTDFQVHGTTTATVTNVAPVGGAGGAQYDVTVSGGNLATFNGVVGLDLKSGQNITDLAGSAFPTTEPAVDQTYTVDHNPPASFAFAGEYSVATVGNSTLTLASITQNGLNLTLNGSSSQAATVLGPTQVQVGATTATYGDSQFVFGPTGPFANQTWTKIDLPANFTNLQGNPTHIIQNGASITFVDKFGGTSPGVWLSPTQLAAFGETVTIGRGKLNWSDGSFWFEDLVLTGTSNGVPPATIVARPSEFTVIDYNNGHGATVHVVETGTSNVIFVDGRGNFSLGSFVDLTHANSEAYPRDTATFSNDGTTVTWQDGYVWTRIAPTNQVTVVDYTNPNGVTTHTVRNNTTEVVFSDGRGILSIGYFINPNVVVDLYYGLDEAFFTSTTINWTDGSVWTPVTTPPPPLVITATNPAGGVSHLSILGRAILIGLDGPLQGVNGVRLNGKIFWANGDVWSNFDFAGLNALFVMGTA